MTFDQLSAKFQQGINWNAAFYAIYKVISTASTFLLYHYMTTTYFAMWANINSIIFLLLLWADFGLRKSIPRYYHEFLQSKEHYHHFLVVITLFQVSVLSIIAIGLFMLPPTYAAFLYLSDNNVIIALVAVLFIVEGIVALLKLIYHAHFQHKQFALLNTAILLAESTATVYLIFFVSPEQLLIALLLTKLIAGCIMILAAARTLQHLPHTDNPTPSAGNPSYSTFAQHSLAMWASTAIKSLSERNVMVPFLTHTLGPAAANTFKIANDSALLFYRTALKTIGTNDTALLARATAFPSAHVLSRAFTQLTSTVTNLCLILALLIGVFCLASPAITTNHLIFQVFCIAIIGYTIETLLSPFERVLEVNGHYRMLWIAYTPYILGITALGVVYSQQASYAQLPYILLLVHGLRVVSSLLMAYYAYTQYALPLPKRALHALISMCIPLLYMAYATSP